MIELQRRYDDWKAPREDGHLLIWPEPAELLRATRENHAALRAEEAPVQGVALREWRGRAREFLAHRDDRMLVATGHQTELYHPGVWVKNALINAAAERLGGESLHVSVDTDAPKHLTIRFPGGSASLTDDPAAGSAAWSGQLASPTPMHLQAARDQVTAAAQDWDFTPGIQPFFDCMRKQAMERVALAPAIADSLHLLDWQLGMRHQTLIASPLWGGVPFLLYAHHLLARAGRLAADYNGALEDFRVEQRVRGPGRPMPDLEISADRCEAPFWLDDLATGERARLGVVRERGQWTLRRGTEAFAFDPDAPGWAAAEALARFLRSLNLRLSPRALTLTMFLRLAVVDMFVHGIGGGRYDQVCDRIIARFFRVVPPRFAVTTATLYFPGAAERERVCLPCIAQAGHRLRHSLLGEQKMELVRQIAAAPRYSPRRQTLFRRMHQQLGAAAGSEPIRQWEERYRQAVERAARDAVLFDRELFLRPATGPSAGADDRALCGGVGAMIRQAASGAGSVQRSTAGAAVAA